MGTTNGDLLTSLFTKGDQAPKPQVHQTAWPVLLPAPTLAAGSQLLAWAPGFPACTPRPPSAPFMWSLMWTNPHKGGCWGLPPKELPHYSQMKKNYNYVNNVWIFKKDSGKKYTKTIKLWLISLLCIFCIRKKNLTLLYSRKKSSLKSILYLVFVLGHTEQLVGS